MNLTERQCAAVAHRGQSLIVSAAAGAGKTAVLVRRVLSLLCDGDDPCDIDRLLVVTFTNAAAGELRSRIGEMLTARLAERPDDRRLRRQLALLPAAQIGTVHAFCRRLLRQNFHLAGLTPDFRTADDSECAELKERALRQTLEELYAAEDADFTALARLLSDGRGDRRLEDAVLELYEKLRSHPEPERWLEYAPALGAADPDAAAWCRAARARGRERLTAARSQLAAARAELRGEADAAYGPSFDALLSFGAALDGALDAGWDQTRAALAGFEKGRLRAVRGGDREFLARMQRARDRFCAAVAALGDDFSASADQIRAESAQAGPLTAALCRAVTRFTGHYDALKRARGCVDFSDLEHLALRLLQNGDHTPSPLAREVRAGLREVLVDEYQDTNEVQERIFRLVTPESGASFFVGDVKQSIYLFRLADPGIFLDRCRMAKEHEDVQRRINLHENFRSRHEVLDLCNHLFSRLMSPRFGGVDYGDGHALAAGGVQEGTAPSEVWLLDGGADEERREEREARACADRIAAMLETERVPLPEGGDRAARPEDFAILLSSYAGKANYFSQALEERNIPCARGGGAFFGALETAVMISYLRILDDPRQDVPLVSVLRSPLWLFSAGDLARLRLRAPGDLYDALLASREADPRCGAFLRHFELYRALSADLPAAALLRRLYDELNAEAVFSALDAGAQRARNLRRLLALAERMPDGGRGVGPFLRWLDRTAQRGDPEDAGPESAGVRLMSVHKSKGLEFPFVLLPDLAKKFNADDQRRPVLIHTELGIGFTLRDEALRTEYPTRLRRAIAARLEESARAEELRKLYVALTRARQKVILVLSAADPPRRIARIAEETGGAPDAVWLAARDNAMDWICAALLTHPDCAALRGLAGCTLPAAGAPEGALICHVLDEPEPAHAAEARSAAAGEEGGWEALLAETEKRYPHLAASALPSKLTPTGAVRLAPDGGELDGTVERPRARAWRQDAVAPRAARTAAQRGTALHLLLRWTDPARCRTAADAAALVASLRESGRLTEEQAALCDPGAALAFARSELGQRAARAERVLREYEFGVLLDASTLLPDGPAGEQVLMNGAIDLLLFEQGALTVVDFKSDRIRPGQEEEKAQAHRLQLEIYARAAREVFGLPVRERWVWFTETGRAARA